MYAACLHSQLTAPPQLNMHGLTGATQVIGALLHGVCTIHTSKSSSEAWVEGSFDVGKKDVQASTAAFLKAMEPHPMWDGPIPVCLVEYCKGESRRLRLVLTSQSLLSKGEKLMMNSNHPVHRSGLLFGYAADGYSDPDWLVVPDEDTPTRGASFTRLAQEGALGFV